MRAPSRMASGASCSINNPSLAIAHCNRACARSRFSVALAAKRRELVTTIVARGKGSAISYSSPRISACFSTMRRNMSGSTGYSKYTEVLRSTNSSATSCKPNRAEAVTRISSGAASMPRAGKIFERISSINISSSASPAATLQHRASRRLKVSRVASRHSATGSNPGSTRPSINGYGYRSQFGGQRGLWPSC